LQSARNRNDLFDEDTGNSLIGGKLVKQHTHALSQLGTSLLYGKGRRWGDEAALSAVLVIHLAEMSCQAAAERSVIPEEHITSVVMHGRNVKLEFNKLIVDSSYKFISIFYLAMFPSLRHDFHSITHYRSKVWSHSEMSLFFKALFLSMKITLNES